LTVPSFTVACVFVICSVMIVLLAGWVVRWAAAVA
jgi:hypothetical protein